MRVVEKRRLYCTMSSGYALCFNAATYHDRKAGTLLHNE